MTEKREFFTVIKYIQPVKADLAEGLVAEVYVQIKRDFGRVVEPFSLHSPLPKLLAGAWMASRESELVGHVRRGFKEAVAAAVSKLNQCLYCVDAHSIMLNATGEYGIANKISNARYDEISNVKIRKLVEWTLATLSPESKILHAPPFSRQDAPEIIGTAVFYHYINRMVSVLLSETPLPSNRPWLKRPLKRVAGLIFSRAIKRPKTAGNSLQFLPEVDLPTDLCWAEKAPNVAGAFARFAAVVEEVGKFALSPRVRAFIIERVNVWNEKAPQLSRSWVEQAVRGLDEAPKVAARLTLLTALAPYQIDEEIVLAFRNHFPEDGKLLGALAWASFTAARRIGTWLHTPPT
ncbi:MAG: alkylhydroperoxidase [Candidatus Bathyarchaeota archaeon]|nr:MAG: alkylhydroperoxidase [Candidatus Bathyarchaeota archaeon]